MANNNLTPRYFGDWHINVQTDKTNPGIIHELRNLFFKLDNNSSPLQYKVLAHIGNQSLGSKIHSENNHAVLAEQYNEADDTNRIVLIVFHGDKSIVSIDRVLESYTHDCKEYDIHIEPNTEFPDEVRKDYEIIQPLFNNILVEPFIYLGNQKCLNGIKYLFVAEVTTLEPITKKEVALVTINAINKSYEITNILF